MLKERILKKTGNKLVAAMPSLINFAVEHDSGYDALIETMKKVNQARKAKRKRIITSI